MEMMLVALDLMMVPLDYDSYKNYRNYIQSNINDRLELLTFECWDDKKVDLNTFNEYLKVLQSQ